MGDTGITEMNPTEKIRPTKVWLEEQVTLCRNAIERNIGAMNFCLSMIKCGAYCEEEKIKEANL